MQNTFQYRRDQCDPVIQHTAHRGHEVYPVQNYNFVKEKSYYRSAAGVLRILIAICELGGIGAIAGVIKLFTILPDEFTLIRDSYIAVSILGFVFSITILGLALLDSFKYKAMKKTYWNVIVSVVFHIYSCIFANFCKQKNGQRWASKVIAKNQIP
jgi:hypothetical protein